VVNTDTGLLFVSFGFTPKGTDQTFERVREELMRKRSFKLSLILMVVTFVTFFQFSLRYKTIEVGVYQLKDDRLTLTVYAKHREDAGWRETKFKTLNRERVYFEKRMLLEETLGERLLLWDDV